MQFTNVLFKKENDRGQVGIGTLIIFIAMVLVAAVAAGVLINTSGQLQAKAQQTGEGSTAQVSDNVAIVSTVGAVSSNQITGINVTVRKSPSAGTIDLSDAVIQLVGPEGETTLTYNTDTQVTAYTPGTATSDHFAVRTIKGTDPILNADSDRMDIYIGFAGAVEPSTRLANLAEDGEVELRIISPSGAQTIVVLEVPSTLDGSGKAVEL